LQGWEGDQLFRRSIILKNNEGNREVIIARSQRETPGLVAVLALLSDTLTSCKMYGTAPAANPPLEHNQTKFFHDRNKNVLLCSI